MDNKAENIFDDFLDNLEDTVKTQGSKFRIEPVSAKVFFKDWLKTPLFPRQQRAVDKAFSIEYNNISSTINEFVLGWGKRCIAKDTVLKDEVTGEEKTVEEFSTSKQRINILSLYWNKITKRWKTKVVKTSVPFKKGKTELFKVTTKTGKTILVSKEHLFKTKNGWVPLEGLKVGNKIMTNDSPKSVLTKEQEKTRVNKIKSSMQGQTKSKSHIESFRQCTNSGRFTSGQKPWNKGKSGYLSKESRQKIGAAKRGKKESKETRLKKSIAHKGLLNHKDYCSCSCCKTMRGESKFITKPVEYKGILMRSSWEVSYAQYLDKNNVKWEYEPKVFKLKNGSSYIPDFYLPKENVYVEIKGYLSKDSKTKIDSFVKEYPEENLEVLREYHLLAVGVL